jgi:hypothetical protein
MRNAEADFGRKAVLDTIESHTQNLGQTKKAFGVAVADLAQMFGSHDAQALDSPARPAAPRAPRDGRLRRAVPVADPALDAALVAGLGDADDAGQVAGVRLTRYPHVRGCHTVDALLDRK